MSFFNTLWNNLKSFFSKNLQLPEAPAELEDLQPEPSKEEPQEEEMPKKKGQLAPNFHIDEFKCRDGTSVPDKYMANVEELAKNLQVLRDELGKPIKINSGYRTPEYNKKIGGATRSQHMLAKAADIKVKGYGSERLAKKIMKLIEEGKMKKGGVGVYPTFVHYDVRGRNARWSGSRKSN